MKIIIRVLPEVTTHAHAGIPVSSAYLPCAIRIVALLWNWIRATISLRCLAGNITTSTGLCLCKLRKCYSCNNSPNTEATMINTAAFALTIIFHLIGYY